MQASTRLLYRCHFLSQLLPPLACISTLAGRPADTGCVRGGFYRDLAVTRPEVGLTKFLVGKIKDFGFHFTRRVDHSRGATNFCKGSKTDHSESVDKRVVMQSVRIKCRGDIADGLVESLLCFGASSCSIEDAHLGDSREQEIYSDGPVLWQAGHRQLWEQSHITAIFPEEQDVGEAIAMASHSIGFNEMPQYEIALVEDQDWIEQLQGYYIVFLPAYLCGAVVKAVRTEAKVNRHLKTAANSPPNDDSLVRHALCVTPIWYFRAAMVLFHKLSEWAVAGVSVHMNMFEPLEVAAGLWIVPKWRVPPNPMAVNVILDPGLAFGTGEHPTTRLCLQWLNQVVRGGEFVMDYGIGSGILSIAALKMGAARAVGVDVDPMAISSATYNASLNMIEDHRLQVFLSDMNGGDPVAPGAAYRPSFDNFMDEDQDNRSNSDFNIVIANILAIPLVELSNRITNYARPGGFIGLSGILLEQVDQVRNTYVNYLDNIHVTHDSGWACITGTKKLSV